MYTAHFGLTEPPFSIAPNPRFLYMSPRHREALAHLVYGIEGSGFFVQLTGEVGTGKTTLCRCLLDQLPDNVDVALILNPRISERGLVATICDELHVAYDPATAELKDLVDHLNRYLLERHAQGRRTIVIVDEAQNLSIEVLEQVRLLTNLETNTDKLLRIILVGQPELRRMLRRPELRQLSQRITARYHLEPLSLRETSAYVRYRLAVAGTKEPIFSAGALRAIYRYSSGIPRLINIVCDRALLGAYSQDRRSIEARTVRHAAGEVLGKRPPARVAWSRAWLVALPLLLVIGVGIAVLGPRFGFDPITEFTNNSVAVAPAANIAAEEPVPPVDIPASPTQAIAPPNVATAAPSFSDEHNAFAQLLTLWGVDPQIARAETPCDHIQLLGLRCLELNGTWEDVRRYNRPSMLQLTGPGGDRQYAVVTAIDRDEVEVELPDGRQRITVAELDRYWLGDFRILWMPPLGIESIKPGAEGDEVLWLRQRLDAVGAEIEDNALAATEARLFDENLRSVVADFQRDAALAENGTVGVETLIHLNTAISSPAIPVLALERRL